MALGWLVYAAGGAFWWTVTTGIPEAYFEWKDRAARRWIRKAERFLRYVETHDAPDVRELLAFRNRIEAPTEKQSEPERQRLLDS